MDDQPEEGAVDIVLRIFSRHAQHWAQRELESERGLPPSPYPDQLKEADETDRIAVEWLYEQAPPEEWAQRYRARKRERTDA